MKSKGPLALYGSISFKFRGKLNYPVVTGHESAKDWQAYFFYVKNDAALETSGYPAFAPTAAEENEYWTGRGAQPTDPRLLRCIRRIDQHMINNLRGLDLVLCWAKRRVQPLQHRKKLLCQYSGKKDEMRTKADDLSQDAFTCTANLNLMFS